MLSPLIDERSDQRRPAGLMRGTEASASVPMKILVELWQVAPLRVILEAAILAVYRAAAFLVAGEDADQAVGLVAGHFAERQPAAVRRRDMKFVAPGLSQ